MNLRKKEDKDMLNVLEELEQRTFEEVIVEKRDDQKKWRCKNFDANRREARKHKSGDLVVIKEHSLGLKIDRSQGI